MMGTTTQELAQTKLVVRLRPSRANLYAKCAAGAHGRHDDFTINWDDAAGRVGQALHMAAAAMVARKPVPHDEIKARFHLSANQQHDLRRLQGCAGKYCREQLHGGGWSTPFVIEQRMEARYETEQVVYDLGGTMDVGGFSADHKIWGTVDWKTTRLENADYQPQQMFYLYLAARWIQANLPPTKWPTHYQYHIVFVRDWTEEVSEAYRPEDLLAWMQGFIQRIESWDGREYCPGGHCLYCPRQADCPAILRMVTAMAYALRHEDFADTAEHASDDALVGFYIAGTAVANLIENAKLLVKALVVGKGGEIISPQGVLTTTPRPNYRIDALTAWPICQAELTERQLADACRLSKTVLEEGVAANHPRGQKKKAKDTFWDRLCESGAVEQNDSLVLRLKSARTIPETSIEDN